MLQVAGLRTSLVWNNCFDTKLMLWNSIPASLSQFVQHGFTDDLVSDWLSFYTDRCILGMAKTECYQNNNRQKCYGNIRPQSFSLCISIYMAYDEPDAYVSDHLVTASWMHQWFAKWNECVFFTNNIYSIANPLSSKYEYKVLQFSGRTKENS